jgi:hypothetical protein
MVVVEREVVAFGDQFLALCLKQIGDQIRYESVASEKLKVFRVEHLHTSQVEAPGNPLGFLIDPVIEHYMDTKVPARVRPNLRSTARSGRGVATP